MRCFLSGPIDRVEDYGIKWRHDITSFLESLGIVVLNPMDKPIKLGSEVEDRKIRKILTEKKNFKKMSKIMKEIRVIDLRMVDMSDFIIVKVDLDVHMCGTYEEISWANRIKRPILVWSCGGKEKLPEWLWGMVPREHVFNSIEEIKDYLKDVHTGKSVKKLKRWMFFEYEKMLPKVSVEESRNEI